jgi:membrane protein YqaA with SNARE-associated domain
MSELSALFVAVFVLNILPAFAPPTWMAISWVGFSVPTASPFLIALVGAAASTSGRLALARMSKVILRNTLLSERSKDNVDILRQYLEARKARTAGGMLLYAFTPFPTNYLFIAYGLTTLPFWLIALPFFVGRFVSYASWALLAQAAANHFEIETSGAGQYLSVYFVMSQILILTLVYVFTKIDWRTLIHDRKIRWLRPGAAKWPNGN